MNPASPGWFTGRRCAVGVFVLCASALSGCASTGGGQSGKVMVTRGAYELLQKNHQATAVFADKARNAPDAELICERILMGRRMRTLCYARFEEAARVRDHKDKWIELTTLPGAGG